MALILSALAWLASLILMVPLGWVGGLSASMPSSGGDSLVNVKVPIAASPSVDALVDEAWRYREGTGVEQSYAKAAELLEKAAKLGSPRAQYDLGILHFYGLGTPESPEQASHWFEQAGQRNYGPAVTMLGTLAMGDNQEPNDKAMDLFRRAAKLGDPWGEYLLGSAYLKRRQGTDDNLPRALYWLQKAQQHGVEPIKGLVLQLWSMIPDEDAERVGKDVAQWLDNNVEPTP